MSDLAFSAQVLGEFYVQATRRSREDRLWHEQATKLVASFTRLDVVQLATESVKSALVLRERYGTAHHLHVALDTRKTGKLVVHGHERCAKRFSQRHVPGVVSGGVLT